MVKPKNQFFVCLKSLGFATPGYKYWNTVHTFPYVHTVPYCKRSRTYVVPVLYVLLDGNVARTRLGDDLITITRKRK